MGETTLTDAAAVQGRVTVRAPEGGWSREAYDRAIVAYTTERGREPQTATMHPDTAWTLRLHEEDAPGRRGPMVVTSVDYDPATITWYY
jgi:hypothetical protein